MTKIDDGIWIYFITFASKIIVEINHHDINPIKEKISDTFVETILILYLFCKNIEVLIYRKSKSKNKFNLLQWHFQINIIKKSDR